MQDSKAAMAKLNETIENIGKKEDHLQRKYDAEFANAKEFHVAGKKREALQSIKKMKVYDQQLTQLGTTKITLKNQKLTQESMIMSAEIIELQRVVTTSMQAQVKKMGGVEKVEELMDAVEDNMTDVQQMQDDQEAMNRSIDADDDELLAELDELLKEELAADLSKVAGTKKVMRDKERELAELEASVLAMAPRRRFFIDLLSPLRSLLPQNLAPR